MPDNGAFVNPVPRRTDDPYGTSGGYRDPYLLDDEYCCWDREQLTRALEHAGPVELSFLQWAGALK